MLDFKKILTMKRDEKVSGFYHELLKHDSEYINVYIDSLSTSIHYGKKSDILEDIKSLKKYLTLMEKAVKNAD